VQSKQTMTNPICISLCSIHQTRALQKSPYQITHSFPPIPTQGHHHQFILNSPI
jgi:hypothetical protein